ncbi:hypothetical protein BJ138DRAFT_1117269 [Hygrophoropsis aurantiaca]|uniref:Uncharacterized protein n=1 Tax=Hygrophoropsis aurantiaca TaxID=72124 RepID=A0ACB8A0G4_9AGAM|nr:hypothetical protein BJ138DRAFT_1117269 [Hygrophoropsis aurantiaca]
MPSATRSGPLRLPQAASAPARRGRRRAEAQITPLVQSQTVVDNTVGPGSPLTPTPSDSEAVSHLPGINLLGLHDRSPPSSLQALARRNSFADAATVVSSSTTEFGPIWSPSARMQQPPQDLSHYESILHQHNSDATIEHNQTHIEFGPTQATSAHHSQSLLPLLYMEQNPIPSNMQNIGCSDSSSQSLFPTASGPLPLDDTFARQFSTWVFSPDLTSNHGLGVNVVDNPGAAGERVPVASIGGSIQPTASCPDDDTSAPTLLPLLEAQNPEHPFHAGIPISDMNEPSPFVVNNHNLSASNDNIRIDLPLTSTQPGSVALHPVQPRLTNLAGMNEALAVYREAQLRRAIHGSNTSVDTPSMPLGGIPSQGRQHTHLDVLPLAPSPSSIPSELSDPTLRRRLAIAHYLDATYIVEGHRLHLIHNTSRFKAAYQHAQAVVIIEGIVARLLMEQSPHHGLEITVSDVAIWAGLNARSYRNDRTHIARARGLCTYLAQLVRGPGYEQSVPLMQRQKEALDLGRLAMLFAPEPLPASGQPLRDVEQRVVARMTMRELQNICEPYLALITPFTPPSDEMIEPYYSPDEQQ